MSQILFLLHDTPSAKRGAIIEARATGSPFGGQEPLHFGLIKITDSFREAERQFEKSWEQKLTFNIIASNLSLDGHRIEIVSDVNTSGGGSVKKERVESFINKWNGVVFQFSSNSVVFDIKIFDAIQSEGFWDINISNIIWSEVYTQSGGVHVVTADYSLLGNTPNYVEDFVAQKTILISHDGDNKIITFETTRNNVRDEFQDDIKNTQFEISRRRFYIPESNIVDIVANGGILEMTRANFLTIVKDQLED